MVPRATGRAPNDTVSDSRDTLSLALVHGLPVTNSWDEMFSEDEHLLIRQIRNQVNWSEPFAEAPVVLTVDDECANIEGTVWKKIAAYEEAFARMGLMYRFVAAGGPEAKTGAFTIDARQPLKRPQFQSEGGALPDSLKAEVPLVVDPGYATNHLWWRDRRTLLAYAYNTTNHEYDYMWLCGTYHRAPRAAAFAPAATKLTHGEPDGANLRFEYEGHGGGRFDTKWAGNHRLFTLRSTIILCL